MRLSSARRTFVGVALGGALVAGSLAGVGAIDRPAAAARSFGNTPYQDVVDAAESTGRSCSISDAGLAALVFSVTWPETGAGTGPPSPMTLSRYDTQAGLFYGGNPNTAYQRAFFHPGVGMWQFDSAGLGAPRYAGHYISTGGGAPAAAATMAARYCAASGTGAQRRAAAWQPWHACSSGQCEAIFGQIYSNGSLVGISGTSSVGRRGGMVERTCARGGTGGTFPCFYVDPAVAQGQDWWAAPSAGQSPISDPFYVFESNGHEVRAWLKEDTGYGIDVEAWRPLGQNARSSLSWQSQSNLCVRVSTVPQTFCDVFPTHDFFDEIEWVAAEGIASGYPDGDFKPTAAVSRQAMAAFMYRLAGGSGPAPGTPTFSDVGTGHAFFTEIEWLVDREVVSGYEDGTFRPLTSVSRQAMAAFLYRLADPAGYTPPASSTFPDVTPTSPFFAEIHWLVEETITTGYPDGTYRPNNSVSRQAMAAFLFRIDELGLVG